MATKRTRLTHKIEIQLQRAVSFTTVAPGCQSGNFWIHPFLYTKSAKIYDVFSMISLRGITQ